MRDTVSELTIDALLAELDTRDIRLRVEDGRLRFIAPTGALTDELRAQLQRHKSEIMERLHAAPKVSIQPSSFPQRRFFALQQLNPTASFYNDPFLFRLRGRLDAGLLLKAFNAIVARHDILRTTLQERDGQVWQRIEPTGEMDWMELDMRSEPAGAAMEFLHREMHRPFDLTSSPGLRGVLARTGDEEYHLQICFHNTVFDLFSMAVVLKEASSHYAALARGVPNDLPTPAQYTDYVRWQDSVRESGMERRRLYWEEWFRRGDPPPWAWKGQKNSDPNAGFDSHVNWIIESPERTEEIHAMCRKHGVTPYIAVLTALVITMQSYTGCADLTLGTTYSNRDDWRFASMIGATILVPALRFDSSDDPTLAVLLGRVRDVVADAWTYQDVPVDQVIPRDPKKPLFRVVCSAFPETPHGKMQLPGIETEWMEQWINDISRPDLYVVMWQSPAERGTKLTCHMMHKQSVFEAETAAAMAKRFAAVLEAMTKDTMQTTGALLQTC